MKETDETFLEFYELNYLGEDESKKIIADIVFNRRKVDKEIDSGASCPMINMKTY